MSTPESPEIRDVDIAVVGMALRVPGARTPEEFWANLAEGVESIVPIDEDTLRARGISPETLSDPDYVPMSAPIPDMEMFDAAFFGFTPRDAQIMDPQHRQFLECAWEALERSGYRARDFDGAIGVFGGSGHNAYMPLNLFTNPDLMDSMGLFLVRHTGNDKDFLTTRVSYELGLTGPSVNVQTACSTSLVSVHLAAQSLLSRECDLALAGGVTIELPHGVGYRWKEGEILSPDGHCRPFDASSEGTVFGSGAAIVVLKRLEDAVADGDTIHAVLKGSAVNNDGSAKIGYLAPSVDGQAHAISEALAVSEIDVETIGYLEAHGTGTRLGDPIEFTALTQAFREFTDKRTFCRLGSVKSNIGHLDTAAGVVGMIKAILALENEAIPPTLHFRAPNPECRFEDSPFRVNSELESWPRSDRPRRAGVSSLGVGGTNAHVVLEEAPADSAVSGVPSDTVREDLYVFSARDADALDRATDRFIRWADRSEPVSGADVAHTLRVGREVFAERAALVAGSVDDAARFLDENDAVAVARGQADGDRPVAFLFAGGGAQYPGMGLGLYRSESVYREVIDHGLEALGDDAGNDSVAELLLRPGESTSQEEQGRALEQPSLALPALFLTQVAQARLWESWGVVPEAMLGHSMGEYTAAHLAGVLTLEDALRLVSLRGRLFETIPGGAMLSVNLSESNLSPHLPNGISIAALNGPELTVASGPVDGIESLQRMLSDRDIESARIRISVAAHSQMLDPILEEFRTFLRTVPFGAPSIRYVSNLTGDWVTDEQAMNPDYWVDHLRSPVRFSDGLESLFSAEVLLLEAGPGRVLSGLARSHPACPAGVKPVSSMRHPRDELSDRTAMLRAAARIWVQGANLDEFGRVHGMERRRTPLPTYPFARERHWIEPGRAIDRDREVWADREETGDTPRLYRPRWNLLDLDLEGRATESNGVEPVEPGVTWVCGDGGGLSHALERVIDRFGGKPVPTGIETDEAAWEAILHRSEQANELPRHILYLATGEGDRAMYGLLALARAIGMVGVEAPIRIAVVTDRGHRVGGDVELRPEGALPRGVATVLPREYPNLSTISIDLSLANPDEALRSTANDVLRELLYAPSDSVVALRGEDRWVRSHERVRSESPPSLDGDDAWIRPGGQYWITGGFGGIGRAIATRLVASYGARITLISRTELPDRSRWDERDALEPSIADRIRFVRDLESRGGDVSVLAVDVSDPEALSETLRSHEARVGVPEGVIHAAGTIDDAPVQFKDSASVAAVLAPKVTGTLSLLDFWAGREEGDHPKFLLLFSSISAFAGMPGQADYAAANAFLDALAESRVRAPGPVLRAVNWPVWRDTGMVGDWTPSTDGDADEPTEWTESSHPLFDRCGFIAGDRWTGYGRLGVDSHWVVGEHRVRGGDALLPGTGFLEFVRAGFREAVPSNDPVRISEMSFQAPFAVRDDRARTLHLTLEREASGGHWTFEVWSDEAPDGDVRSTVHVTGYVTDEVGCEGEGTYDRELRTEALGREPQPTPERQPDHLSFGPRWSVLKSVERGRGEALLRLSLSPDFEADLDGFGLHPAMVDMATAGVQDIIPGFDPERDFYVPLSYGSVVAYDRIPGDIFSHLRLRAEDSAPGEFVVFDVTIVDSESRVLLELSEFVMIRLADKELLSVDASAPELKGSERSPALASLFRTAWDAGIEVDEGLDLLETLLHPGGRSRTVVCRGDLDSVIAALRESPEVEPASGDGDLDPVLPPSGRDLSPVGEALSGHPAILDAAAWEFEERPGDWKLIAFVVYDPMESVTVSELRRHLRAELPEDLIPKGFVETPEIPRSQDGSIRTRALDSPFGPVGGEALPSSEAEKAIAAMWRDLLGVDRVGLRDNFFDIGGHSLLAIRFISRVGKEFGVRLQHEHVVVNTLEQLAARCQGSAATPSVPS